MTSHLSRNKWLGRVHRVLEKCRVARAGSGAELENEHHLKDQADQLFQTRSGVRANILQRPFIARVVVEQPQQIENRF